MPDIEQEVEQFLIDYVRDFNKLDLEAVVSHFYLPCTFIVPREVLAFASASEVEGFWSPRLDDLKKQGFGRVESIERKINVLNDDTAITNSRVVRYAVDGSELGRRHTSFVLRKTNDDWKIVTLIHHSPTPGYSQEIISGSGS